LGKVVRQPSSAAEPYIVRQDAEKQAERAAALGRFEQANEKTTLQGLLAKASRVATRRRRVSELKGVAATDWFCFDEKDDATQSWYPQGVTSHSDAGRKTETFAVSWYWKPEPEAAPERGIRVSFLNVARLRYEHVLLVEVDAEGNPAPINIHAGGLAWYGDLLYVPDTDSGLRVFDLGHLYKGGLFGYKYTLPQVGMWNCDPALGARFSFAAVDRGADPHLLVSGEYLTSGAGRVVRWALAADGSLAADEQGAAVPVDAYNSPDKKIQGAVSYKGHWYFSQSGTDLGNDNLLDALPGEQVRRRSYPKGPEDLSVWRETKTIWTVAEKPGNRVLFGVAL
jgi:hypothetical protein